MKKRVSFQDDDYDSKLIYVALKTDPMKIVKVLNVQLTSLKQWHDFKRAAAQSVRKLGYDDDLFVFIPFCCR